MEALVGPLSAPVEAYMSHTDSDLGETTLAPASGDHPSPRAHNGKAKGEAETDIRKAWGRSGRAYGKTVSSLHRRRHSRAHAALGVRHMVSALALALLFVVALAVLHRILRCLNGITPEKGNRHRLPGGIFRRLAPDPSDGAEVNTELPTYEEATLEPPLEAWGAPPPYTPPGEEPPPPPSYEDACQVQISTVDRPGTPSASVSQGGSTTAADRLMVLLILLSWLVSIGVAASISGEVGLNVWVLVGIAIGGATLSTFILLFIFGKIRGMARSSSPRQESGGASVGTNNIGSGTDNLGFEM